MPLTFHQRQAFADRLCRVMRRGEPRMTLELLASRIGCSPSTLTGLRIGECSPSRLMLTSLARELGVPASELVPAELHGNLANRLKPYRRAPEGAEPPPLLAPPPPPPKEPSEADRMGAELTYRRLAAHLARALAVAELTIDRLKVGAPRPVVEEWRQALADADHAIRAAGFDGGDFDQAACVLGKNSEACTWP